MENTFESTSVPNTPEITEATALDTDISGMEPVEVTGTPASAAEASQRKKEKEEKKQRALLEKKLNQGTSTIEKMEGKQIADLITKEPTQNVLFIYFGVGSANDCRDIEGFLDNLGYQEKMLDIFPGFPHGFLEFNSVQSSQSLLSKLKKLETDKILAYYIEINFTSKPKTAFFFYSKVSKAELNSNHQNEMPNASSTAKIPGITMIENFVTEEEERAIMAEIDKREWHKLATRRVQHDGYEFVYGQNNVNPNKKLGQLPTWIQSVQKQLEVHSDSVNGAGVGLDQLTINDYNPGDGIPPHTDAISPFEEAFCAVSLLSGAVMAFKHPQTGQTVHLYFPPRSAMIFSGEGRLVWTHAIACRKLDRIDGKLLFRQRRVSLTFRKVRELPPGQLHEMSDSKGKKIDFLLEGKDDKLLMEQIEKSKGNDLPTEIERKYVYEVYNKIAPHFSSTRYKPWPQVVKFLDSLPDGSFVADVGCGNGKYLICEEVSKKHIMVGTDIAENLLKICKQRGCEVFTADSLMLPIKSNTFDHVISIAVLHHFSNDNQRKRAISELVRITKPGGKILITVWAFEQNKKFPKQDLFVPWNLQDNFHQKNVEEGIEDEGSIMQTKPAPEEAVEKYHDEEKHAVVYKRYYHLFVEGELQKLLKGSAEVDVLDSFYNRDNWCVVLGKKH